jgi:hypothetical protein
VILRHGKERETTSKSKAEEREWADRGDGEKADKQNRRPKRPPVFKVKEP